MHVLDNIYLWNFFRKILDLFFGLYRERIKLMRGFGIDSTMSLLDVGCGTGHYSLLTDSEYLGVDMDCRYIENARKLHGSQNKQFECVSLQEAKLGGRTFDISLLADLTHHISDEAGRDLLATLARITNKYLVVFDPVKQKPYNYVGKFLTSLDRGEYIRSKKEELELISEYFDIIEVKDLELFFTNIIIIFAQPKKGI